MQGSGNGLRLEVPTYIRGLSIMISVFGYIAIFLWIPERILVLSLFFWTVVQLRGLMYSPEITVYENGIETSRFGVKRFTPWRDIRYVRVGQINSQIYPDGIAKFVRMFLYSNLLINAWRSNYDKAMEIVKANVEQAQETMPQRAYE